MTLHTTTSRGDSSELWIAEHGESYAVPDAIRFLVSEGLLVDISWHNDVSPSFVRADQAELTNTDDIDRRLWIEHPDPEERESGPGGARFCVLECRDSRIEIETDDLTAALRTLICSDGVLACDECKRSFKHPDGPGNLPVALDEESGLKLCADCIEKLRKPRPLAPPPGGLVEPEFCCPHCGRPLGPPYK